MLRSHAREQAQLLVIPARGLRRYLRVETHQGAAQRRVAASLDRTHQLDPRSALPVARAAPPAPSSPAAPAARARVPPGAARPQLGEEQQPLQHEA